MPQKMRNKELPIVSRRKAVTKARAEINRREGKTQQEQNQGFVYLYIFLFLHPCHSFQSPIHPPLLFCSEKHSSPMSINNIRHIELQYPPPHVLRLAKETQCEE